MKKIDKNIFIVDTMKQPKFTNECPYYTFANLVLYIEEQNFDSFISNKKFISKLNYFKKIYIKLGGININDPNEELELLLMSNINKIKDIKKYMNSYSIITKISDNDIRVQLSNNNNDNIFLIKDTSNCHCYLIIHKNDSYYIIDSMNNNHNIYKNMCTYIEEHVLNKYI
jgi:hypothetical protein